MLKKKNGWYIAAQGVFTVLVFASTVLIKQHFVVDIIAGVAVAETGWILSEKLKLWRFFERIELPFVRVKRACEREEEVAHDA